MRNTEWATEGGPVVGHIYHGKKYRDGNVSAEQYEEDIRKIENEIAGLVQNITDVGARISIIRNDIDALSVKYNAEIPQIISDVSKLKSDVAANKSGISSNAARITDLAIKESDDIAKLNDSINTKIGSVYEVIRIIEGNVDSISAASDKLTSRISDVETVVATLRNQRLNDNNQLNGRIDLINNNIEVIKANASKLNEDLNELKTDTVASIASLNERISVIEGTETIEILSFTATPNIAEKGGTENIVLTWTTRGDVKVTRINGDIVTGNEITMKNITSPVEYTLSVTDAKGVTVTKKVSVTFVNHIYWGCDASGGTGEGVVKALDHEELSDTRPRTITFAPRDQYLIYAYPKRLGPSAFITAMGSGGFKEPAVISMDNHSGFVEDYYVYRSEYKQKLNVEVNVK